MRGPSNIRRRRSTPRPQAMSPSRSWSCRAKRWRCRKTGPPMSPAAPKIRLPGVAFRPSPPMPGPELPLLDVAAFVGFTERGEPNVPIAVNDVLEYRDKFGGDLPLARTTAGRTIYAQTPSAVSAFFANGGRRCYVVRVAGNDLAQFD